jgi:hypothetical protein
MLNYEKKPLQIFLTKIKKDQNLGLKWSKPSQCSVTLKGCWTITFKFILHKCLYCFLLSSRLHIEAFCYNGGCTYRFEKLLIRVSKRFLTRPNWALILFVFNCMFLPYIGGICLQFLYEVHITMLCTRWALCTNIMNIEIAET